VFDGILNFPQQTVLVLRKHFKKYLPTNDSIREHRFLRHLAPVLRHPNLWHLNRHSVAGGVAVGAFSGLMGGPIQMITAAVLAIIFRVNVPVAVASTWYTNPITAVPLTYLSYKIGTFVTGQSGKPLVHFSYDWTNKDWIGALPAFFHWLIQLGPSFLLGAFILALSLAAISYVGIRLLWRLHIVTHWRRRKKQRDL